MPTRPPQFNAKSKPSKPKAWATSRKSRQARGYGREHEIMRDIVLREEPLCRVCQSEGRVTAATIADHIKPLAEGGTGDRDNMQPICRPCHHFKTAAESKRARDRRRR